MGRSSRILLLSLVFTASPALAQQHVPLVRAPTNAIGMVAHPRIVAHHMISPRVMTPRITRRTLPARPVYGLRRLRPNLASGYDFGEVGVLGLPGLGLGLPGASEAELQPGVIPAELPPPPVCPQIIKIGKGIRHKVRTRVIYGPAAGCVRYP